MRNIPTLNLYPVFATKDGIPFVFLDHQSRTDALFIRHGSIVSCIFCALAEDHPGHPEFYETDETEIFFYGLRGRPVASFLPTENVLQIKRDGKFHQLALEDRRIIAFLSAPTNKCSPELVSAMDRLMQLHIDKTENSLSPVMN